MTEKNVTKKSQIFILCHGSPGHQYFRLSVFFSAVYQTNQRLKPRKKRLKSEMKLTNKTKA